MSFEPYDFRNDNPSFAFTAGAIIMASDILQDKIRFFTRDNLMIDVFEMRGSIENAIKRRLKDDTLDDEEKQKIDSSEFKLEKIETLKDRHGLKENILSSCSDRERNIEEIKEIIDEFQNSIMYYIDKYYISCTDVDYEDASYNLSPSMDMMGCLLRYYGLVIWDCRVVVYNNICFLIMRGTTD